jgi:hypothetical protein
MTRKTIVAVVAAVIVIGGGTAALLLLRHKASQTHRSAAVAARLQDGVPVNAESTVRLLLSARGRQALTPELNGALPHGSKRLFPAGTIFTTRARAWHQTGAYANVTGLLYEPGKAPAKAEIGLVIRHGRWLVTFEGTP